MELNCEFCFGRYTCGKFAEERLPVENKIRARIWFMYSSPYWCRKIVCKLYLPVSKSESVIPRISCQLQFTIKIGSHFIKRNCDENLKSSNYTLAREDDRRVRFEVFFSAA